VLNKSEEVRLNETIRALNEELIEKDYKNPMYATLRWLTEKLKEVNNECSKVTEELQTANEELARMHEVYDA